jgi:hypothetical protein
MLLTALLLAGLAATGSPQATSVSAKAGASGFWILTCEMPTPGAGAPTDARRTFRLGPQTFQERKPGQAAFGSNLCRSYACASSRERMQGTLSSASLVLTISVDPRTRAGTWRTTGASGLSRTSGDCSVEPEAARAK